MSYLQPDYDYDPLSMMTSPVERDEPIPSKIYQSKNDLIQSIKQFAKDVPDFNLHRFYGNTSIAFRTNTNVFDSVSFFKKFCDAYLFSLKKTFPNISQEQIQELQEKLQETQNLVAETLNCSNIENKYLLALSLGILESMLDYENY